MSRTLLVSIVLHVVVIALVLTIRFPEPIRALTARVMPIASPYRPPVPVKLRTNIQPLRLPHLEARTFRVPESTPQPVPQHLALAVPEPPTIHAPAILLAPPIVTTIIDVPPVRVVKTAGFSSLEASGIAQAPRKLAATGGFDGADAVSNKIVPTKISAAAFGDASIAAVALRKNQISAFSNFSAAEILSKPRPIYSDEARRLQIEGEVLLEVVFGASGEVRVLRTIKGLGHGLDENAIAAARAIHFRAAQRDGSAVDSTAVIHIVFQLAN